MNDDRHGAWRPALLVFLVALVALAIAQLGIAEEEMNHDSAHYLELARSLLRGQGFETQTHWALNIPITEIVRPDTYRSPLYPVLIAAFSKLAPDLHTAAKWVSVLSGAFVPLLVFLFCYRRLGLSLLVSLLGAALTIAHHHLVISAVRPLTESPYTALTMGALYLATAPPPRALASGILAGFAWLVRYQGLLLFPCVVPPFLAAGSTRRTWIVRLALFTVGFAVVSAPWMIRNVRVAGAPFYTELRYHMVSTYDRDRTIYHYFHGLEPVRQPLDYMRAHPDQTIQHFVRGMKKIARGFAKENGGNPFLAVAALLGGVIWITRRRDQWRLFTPFVLLGLANVGLVAISFVDDRHLTSLDPILMILVAVLIGWIFERLRGTWPKVVVLALVAIAILWETRVSYKALAPYRPQYFEFVEATREFLSPRLGPNDAVMGEKPYFLSLVLDRRAVSLPWCSDEDFVALADSFGVRYACVGGFNEEHFGVPFPGSFLDTGVLPPRLTPVFEVEDPPVVVYEILKETEAAPAEAGEGEGEGEGGEGEARAGASE